MREYSLEICDTIAEISALYSLYYRSMFNKSHWSFIISLQRFHLSCGCDNYCFYVWTLSLQGPYLETFACELHTMWMAENSFTGLIFNYRCQITGESFLLLASCGWGVWLFVNTVALRFDQTQSLARDNVFIEMLSCWASIGVCVCTCGLGRACQDLLMACNDS